MTMLAPNQVFAPPDRPEECVRILAVLPGGELLYYIELWRESALPIPCGLADFEARIRNEDLMPLAHEPAYARAPADSQMTKSAQKVRDRRYKKIKELVEDTDLSILDPPLRHRLLLGTEERLRVSRSHLYESLRLWWRNGQLPNALAPQYHRCGRRGQERVPGKKKRGRPPIIAGTVRGVGVNVTPEAATKLREGVRFLKKGRSWPQAFKEISLIHFLSPALVDGKRVLLPAGERPTLEQFKYHVGKILSPADIERATKGQAAFERNRAERTGFSRDIPFGPGDIFQLDATIANIYLRSRYDPDQLVGRPVLYLVTDQSSGLIVGFTAALGNASWDVAKLALENAFTDKVASSRAMRVDLGEGDWPSRHTPKQLTGDRGWEILGRHAGTSGLGLNVTVANLPPYRPDLKGFVEGKFQLLDLEAIHWVAGATHGRTRGDLDDRSNKLDGFYDLDAFREFMIRAIVRHNHTHKAKQPPTWYPLAAEGTPTPIQIWNHGCEHRGVPMTHSAWQVRANLLPEAEGKMTDHGLKVGRLHYAPTDPDERRIFDRVRGRRWTSVKVKHDPRDVSTILMPMEDGEFGVWTLIPADRRFLHWSLDEVAESFARRRALDSIAENERMSHEQRFKETTTALDKRVRDDAKRKRAELGHDGPDGRKIELTANKEARALETRERKGEEAWTAVAKGAAKPPPSSIRPARPSASPGAIPAVPRPMPTSQPVRRPSKLAMLDKIAEEMEEGKKQ